MENWRNESAFDVLNLILGGFLCVTPWIFNFTGSDAASHNAWLMGAVIAMVAFAALVAFAVWEEWVNLILGLWVLISPWALGFSEMPTPTYVHVGVGIVVAVIAAVELWWVNRHPPHVTAA